MKPLLFFILTIFLLSSTSIIAQDAYHQRLLEELEEDYGVVGGEWVVSGNEFTTMGNLFYWGVSNYTLEDAEGQTFTQAVSATISEMQDNPWNSGIGVINNEAIEEGDKLLMVVWMRGTTGSASSASTNMFFEDNTEYQKEMSLEAKLSKDWRQYMISFEAKRSFEPWAAQLVWHLNLNLQTVEIGGLALLNYGNTYELYELPEESHVTYDGRELDAEWRTAAAERIDLYRKANLEVLVVDENGKPIPNATVSVKMQQHDYAFGTAVVGCAIAGNNCQDDFYQEKIRNLDGKGHGFNEVVFENAFKWDAWEENWTGSPQQTAEATQWLVNQNIRVRGHNLVWPSWDYMPDDMAANSGDIDYLKNRIDERLETVLNYPVLAENVLEWDVLNEIVWNRSLEFAAAGKNNYTTGRELYAEIFDKARQESPDLVAYINDCVTICQGGENEEWYNTWKTYIQEIIDEGAQIDGIGFQAHMGAKPVSPEVVYGILEDFHQTFGLKAKITEFDMANMSKSVTADYMRDFMTVVFSHPSTEGFLMWGFWDGRHWLSDAPLFDQNWNLKPSGQSFMDLVFKEWWTNESLVADENGRVLSRAFKGDYTISVSFNGEIYATVPLQLKSNESIVIELPIATNIEEIENQNRFVLYPNPSTGAFQLQYDFPQNSELQFEVYDLLGRQLQTFSKNVVPQRVFRHSFELPVGIYFVKVQDGQRVMVEKVIVN